MNEVSYACLYHMANVFTLSDNESENAADRAHIIDASTKEHILGSLENYLKKPIPLNVRGHDIHTLKDQGDFFLQWWDELMYVPKFGGIAPSIYVFSVAVPNNLKRQGIASGIMEMLEQYATRMKRVVYVGPILSEEMSLLLEKRNYVFIPPFYALWINPKFRIRLSNLVPQNKEEVLALP